MSPQDNNFVYGTFSFPHVRVRIDSGIVYDPAGVNQVGVGYTFTLTGVLSGTSQADLESKITEMKCQAMQPRRHFTYSWSGSILWDVDESHDINWGPKPIQVNFNRFPGGQSTFYTWIMQVVLKECYSNSSGSAGCDPQARKSEILSINWEYQHRIDPDGFTTRTVTGTLLVTSFAAQNGNTADYFRFFITDQLPVPKWFKRTAQNFTQSQDGRMLSFEIVDSEQYWTLPKPATTGKVSFTMSLNSVFDKTWALATEYTLSGWLRTSAAHSKQSLLTIMFNLIANKFPINKKGVNLIPMQRRISENVYENEIEFTITALAPLGTLPGQGATGTGGGGDQSGLLNVNDFNPIVGLTTLGDAPPDSDGAALILNPYGQSDDLSSGVVANVITPYDACAPIFAPVKQTIPEGSVTPGEDGGQQPQTGSQYPDQNSGASKSQLTNPYPMVHEEYDYHVDNHIISLNPKLPNANPIFQQTQLPELYMTYAGYYKQFATSAKDVRIVPQLPNQANWKIMLSNITPATPDPNSDGTWNVYTVHFRYVAKFIGALAQPDLSDVGLTFPPDPRRPSFDTPTALGEDFPPFAQNTAIVQVPTTNQNA